MKILCLIDSLGSGGAQRQMVELAKGFTAKGHKVSFLIYHDINFYKNELDFTDINVKVISESNYIRRLFRIRKEIRVSKPDVLLSFLDSSNFIAEFSSIPYKSWKLIVGERSSNPKLKTNYKLRLYKTFHLFADYIVSNSFANATLLKEVTPFVNKKKLKVIYNALDSNFWSPIDNSKAQDIPIKIVVASSHQFLKNLRGLIEALNLMSESEKINFNITWYGDESLDDSLKEGKKLLKKYSINKNILDFRKATSDIFKAYQNADAVALFSFYEGLPNTVCEAMMMQLPVVASNVSDIPLLITSDLTFDPNDPVSIKETLLLLISKKGVELRTIGSENRKKALEYFKKDTIIDKYLNLMEK